MYSNNNNDDFTLINGGDALEASLGNDLDAMETNNGAEITQSMIFGSPNAVNDIVSVDIDDNDSPNNNGNKNNNSGTDNRNSYKAGISNPDNTLSNEYDDTNEDNNESPPARHKKSRHSERHNKHHRHSSSHHNKKKKHHHHHDDRHSSKKKSGKSENEEYFDRGRIERRDRPHAYDKDLDEKEKARQRRLKEEFAQLDKDISVCNDSEEQCRFAIVFGFCILAVVIGVFVGLYFGLYSVETNNDNNPVLDNKNDFSPVIIDNNNNNNNNNNNKNKASQNQNENKNENNNGNNNNNNNNNNNKNKKNNEQKGETNGVITADKDGILRPVCENGIFSAVSWESVTSIIGNENSICNSNQIKNFDASMKLLTPSDPDRIVSAYFDCVNNNANTNVCPKLSLKSFNHNNNVNAQIIRGNVALKSKSMDFANSKPQMECINSLYNDIKIEYGPYNNNENFQECINIRVNNNDETSNNYNLYDYDIFLRDSASKNTPNLRVEFILDSIDLEQGFDYLSLSWMYNNTLFDHSYVTWTGQDTKATDESNDINKPPLFWNVLPGDSLEICLNLQSDESVNGNGFKGHFEIREQTGEWTPFTQCETAKSNSISRWDGACGIGIKSKKHTCPNDKSMKNETHICNQNEEFLNEFCTKAKCENVDNSKLDDMPSNIKTDEGWLKHKWNGVTRYDPIYSDPFRYLQSPPMNRRIDISHLKTEITNKMKEIASRYGDVRELEYSIGEINHYDSLVTRLEKRLLKSLLLGRRFVLAFTGSSNTAGHDNMFMSSYSMQLQSIMRTFWSKIGIYGSSFVVHNSAVGGHLGTDKLRWCVSQIATNDADMVFWESLMNDAGYKGAYDYYETWVRNVVSMPKHPLYGVISTGDAAGRYGDPCSKPYCKITDKVNIYWWKEIEPLYANMNKGYNMVFTAFERGCYGLGTSNDECKDTHVTWHPGPHGHRLNAEVLAYWYLKVTLNGLTKYENDINKLLNSNKEPTLGLECLLGETNGPAWDNNEQEFIKWPENMINGKYCKDTCNISPSWCISSYYPMPQHNRIGEYVLDKFVVNENSEHVTRNFSKTAIKKTSGWYAQDDVDKSVHPLLFRKGGQAPIDHKVEFESSKVGSILHVNVKVPSEAILVLDPISGGGDEWLQQFKFQVDNNDVECKYSGETNGKYNYKGKVFCYISATKGKHVLSIEYATKVSSHNKAAIDMIVGI